MRMLLVVTAAAEALTGLVLTIAPSLVIRLLFGADASGVTLAIGRLTGIALLGLGIACWPVRVATVEQAPALRAMSTYNVLATLYFVTLGLRGQWVGPLLWPAAIAHTVLSAWCLIVLFRGRGAVRAATSGATP